MGIKGIGRYVEDYLAFLSVEKGLAQSTIDGYRVYLGRLFLFIGGRCPGRGRRGHNQAIFGEGDIAAFVTWEEDQLPYQIDAESILNILSDPPGMACKTLVQK